ncbi:protein O-GlcNAcase [Streptococcus parauberis]|uniref:protein O-GlcNAcase n=1 Tax=Streptococcus parauberis TaxID=1348 RepID=UPI000E3A0124|nr:protein O-GlcNAcase [Streptococcus parauberis]RFE02655.1 O-GlcNAcase precursor [Streptococcus parauberis]
MVISLYNQLKSYQEVITRGDVLVLPRPVKVAFKGQFFRFQNQVSLNSKLANAAYFEWVTDDSASLQICHQYDRALPADAFSLIVKSDQTITIHSSNMRGFAYAQEALEKIIIQANNRLEIAQVSIKHSPSFQLRGVIEGFYGRPWTRAERKDCLQFLGQNRMNTYMYAPKNDDFLRKQWRDLYPDEWIAYFKELLAAARTNQVDFWYMISPGLDFDYCDPEDYQFLYQKLQQMIDLGVNRFGLLLDDIDYTIMENVEKYFQTTAFAQGHLVNQVFAYLKEKQALVDLVVCPTEYDNAFDSLYLKQLSEVIAPEIPFFWTGPSTLASQISEADADLIQQVYQRPIIIWDNIPVNDYQKDYQRVFISPYANRSPHLANPNYQVQGIVSNPMINWELSKIILLDMSHYLWDASHYEPASSFKETLRTYMDSEVEANALEIFAYHNGNRHMHQDCPFAIFQAIKDKNISFLEASLKELAKAGQLLKQSKNEAFVQSISPWLARLEEDLAFWQAIQESQSDLEKRYQAILQLPNRTGSDIAVRYYDTHVLKKTDDNQANVGLAQAKDYQKKLIQF